MSLSLFPDCQDTQESSYGDLFSWTIPSNVAYIEFSRILSSGYIREPVVLWNRSDTSSSRGTLKRNHYEIPVLKQKHSGYYRCYGPNGDLLQWKKVNVKGEVICSSSILTKSSF